MINGHQENENDKGNGDGVDRINSDDDENIPDNNIVRVPSNQQLHIDIPANNPINPQNQPHPQLFHQQLSSQRSFLVAQDNLENAPNQETINEANALYLLMLSEQMKQLGLHLNSIGIHRILYRPSYSNATSLRTLAQQFAHSPQRKWVYEQAMSVDPYSLTFSTFQQLLNGLFEEGGVTWERVLVLFYFCSDLSIRVFQEKIIGTFLEIHHWTIIFLSGRFSSWIDAQGGWAVVLGNSTSFITTASLVLVCSIILTAAFMYLRRH